MQYYMLRFFLLNHQGKYSLGEPILPQSYAMLVMENGEVKTKTEFISGN